MDDIRVGSWIELQAVLYDVSRNPETHKRYRSDYAYRGVADDSWGLETSLYQWALMTIMPGARLVLSDFLRVHPELYDRVIIPKEL